MNRAAVRIEPADLTRLRLQLDADAALGDLKSERLRAIVILAHAAALDVSEVLAVRLRHAVDASAARRWTVSAPVYLPLPHRQTAILPASAARELERWIRQAAHARLFRWPPSPSALLFPGDDAGKISPRTVQAQFAALQRKAGTAARYRFQDLRHDAIHRYAQQNRNAALVAQYARISERSALAYLPAAPRATLAELSRFDGPPTSAIVREPCFD
jgi:site-specific recombinase XerC